MKMKREVLFDIGGHTLEMDMVLVEYIYPVLFTCVDEQDQMYIATCYLSTGEQKEWLVASTTPTDVISLLQNETSLRDIFLNTNLWQAVLQRSDSSPTVQRIKDTEVDRFLPTEGEFMDSEPGEFDEEIQILSHRTDRIQRFYSRAPYYFGVAIYSIPQFLSDSLRIDKNMYKIIQKEVINNVSA